MHFLLILPCKKLIDDMTDYRRHAASLFFPPCWHLLLYWPWEDQGAGPRAKLVALSAGYLSRVGHFDAKINLFSTSKEHNINLAILSATLSCVASKITSLDVI
jgi:hypothetical protein